MICAIVFWWYCSLEIQWIKIVTCGTLTLQEVDWNFQGCKAQEDISRPRTHKYQRVALDLTIYQEQLQYNLDLHLKEIREMSCYELVLTSRLSCFHWHYQIIYQIIIVHAISQFYYDYWCLIFIIFRYNT